MFMCVFTFAALSVELCVVKFVFAQPKAVASNASLFYDEGKAQARDVALGDFRTGWYDCGDEVVFALVVLRVCLLYECVSHLCECLEGDDSLL